MNSYSHFVSYSKERCYKNIPAIIQYHEKSVDESIEIAKYLLDHGANINAENENWPTPVGLTGTINQEKIFDFFLDYSQNVFKTPIDVKKQRILRYVIGNGQNYEFFEKIIGMCSVLTVIQP